MADAPAQGQFTYFVDSSGQTQKIPLSEAGGAAMKGWTPASKEQVSDLKLEEKYGSTEEQLKTFAEGAGQTLTFGGSTWAEKALGVPTENIEGRAKVSPGVHFAGELTGGAIPVIASAGAAALPESGALGVAKAATSLSAPSIIARAGEGAAALLPEAATSAAGRVGLAVARGAASAGTEGALYGAGHVVHEAALGDPNLTWQSAAEEVGLSGLLGGGIGATGGVLSGLTREVAAGPIGEKLEAWSNTFEGHQNIKTASGPGGGKKAINWLGKKYGDKGATKIGQEAGELGLIDHFDGPQSVFDKATSMTSEVGPKIDEAVGAVDALPKASHPAVKEFIGGIETKALEDIDVAGGDKALVNQIKDEIKNISADLGGADAKVTFQKMNEVRRAINERIYGYRGNMTISTSYKAALKDIADGFGDTMMKGIDSSGADSGAIKALNRQYSVAATVAHIAEGGLGNAGLSGVPLTALISGAAGLVSGGPLGAAALGAGAMLAKRYGPGVLAAGARGLRNLVDEGGAESLVNKTAELIASERRAATGEAGATGAAGASRLARAFDIASEKLEPAIAPLKDATRDVAQEHVGRVERDASSSPETMAALSQLEKAKQAVDAKVNALARSVVTGTAAPAGAKKIAERDDGHLSLDRIHQLANNPDLLQQQITKATAELTAHAPSIAQAAAVHMSKSVSYLNAKYPPMPKLGPLGPVLKMPKSQLFQMHKTQSVINKPTLLLKHAANYQLTPELVAAVQATAPERLAHMQQAVLQSVAEHSDSVPYKSRLMIGILMGRDMDGSTTPQSIQSAQLAYAIPSAKSPESQAPAGKSTQTGLSKLNLAGSMRLPGQASESRRRSDA